MARTKRSTTLAERDTFHVLGIEGVEVAVKGPAGPQAPGALALVVAQGHAGRAAEPITLTVERRSLFGPATPLYRVVRDEDGNVLTFTLDAQD